VVNSFYQKRIQSFSTKTISDMTRRYTLIFILLSFALISIGQTLPGKLLLVGGGTENAGKWSDAPYAWAVEQSANKRVAIVTYETNPSQWLPDYFKDLGAVEARNFSIPSTAVANQQETYDSLVTYDVIFFKGGNQKTYYNTYKNTLTHQAVEVVFNNGGVIGGTSAGEMILSKVLFTAQNGTVYPDEAIFNPNNQYMTLADDFLQLMPGYIFDSHFVERARFARLIGFLGNWKLNRDEDIVGIGVDDKTAFCIDENLIGYAFGTGAANIYKAAPDNEFSLGEIKLLATNLEVIQVLNGRTINLNTFEVAGYDDFIPAKYEGEDFGGILVKFF
jgi:cyanophycinase